MEGKIPKLIKKWTCHKLECFADMLEAYAQMPGGTKHSYVELYAGCGCCICKDSRCQIDDSGLRVLKAKTGFDKYIFVVQDPEDARNLEGLTAPYSTQNSIEIITGNCAGNRVLEQVFDLIPRSSSSFAFIDPPGYRRLRWSLIKKLASHSGDWKGHKMELLIIFPLEMALLRNLTRPECEASITRFYGNRKWQEIKKEWLEGKIKLGEVRLRLVELFKAGLKDLGYRRVVDFRPGGFANPPFYHVILASDSDGSRIEMLKAAWGKDRYLPCELLYGVKG